MADFKIRALPKQFLDGFAQACANRRSQGGPSTEKKAAVDEKKQGSGEKGDCMDVDTDSGGLKASQDSMTTQRG